MTTSDEAQWRLDEARLAAVGAELSLQPTTITVRLPRTLADQAVAAWERDDLDELTGEESVAESTARKRAGALALIGLSIRERGEPDGDRVVVTLDARLVGDALGAADDADLLNR